MGAVQCKLLLLGKTGVGKSTCAAAALGGGEEACKRFPSGDTARAVTVKPATAQVGGVMVQDTPGSLEADSAQVAANLRCVEECAAMLPEKPTHIVFVIAPTNGRVNDDDVRVVRGMAASFGMTAKLMSCATIIVNQVPGRVAGDAAYRSQFLEELAGALQLPLPPSEQIHFIAACGDASASSVPAAAVAVMQRVLSYGPSAGVVLKAVPAGGVHISGTWAEAEAARKRAEEALAARKKREAEAQAQREAEAAAARCELAHARSMMSSGPSVTFSVGWNSNGGWSSHVSRGGGGGFGGFGGGW